MSLGLGLDLCIIGPNGTGVPFEFVNSLYSDGDRSFAQTSSTINKPAATSGFALSCWIYFDGSISNEYVFGHVGDADMFFRFDSSTSATFQTSIGTSTTWTISANSTGWNHVAISLNGGVNELWINSVKSTGSTEDYDAQAVNISLIGRSNTSYGLFTMDELIIDVDGTLTQTQVNSLYKGGKGVLSNTVITSPDIFYRFDQTSGATIVDSSGNGNNATIYFPTNGDWSPHALEAPTITSGSVNSTSPAQVVLTGTNFYSITGLSASGTATIDSYTIDSITQITAVVNVVTAGDYSITVNNIAGSATIASQTIALYDFGNYIQPSLGNTTEYGTAGTVWDSTGRFSSIAISYWAKRPIGADTGKTNVLLSSQSNSATYILHRNTTPYIRFASDGDNNNRQVEWNLNILDNDWHHFYYFNNNASLTEDITQNITGAATATYTVPTTAYPPGGTGMQVAAVVSGGVIDRLRVEAVGSGYRVGDEITFIVDGQEAKAVLSKVPDTVDGVIYLVYDGVLQTRSSAQGAFDGLDNFGSFFYRGNTNSLHSEIAMDDIVFDERVSTVAEAQAIYNNGRGGNVTNIFGSQPLYWYKFNESAPATTIAQSGSVGSADITLANFTGNYLISHPILDVDPLFWMDASAGVTESGGIVSAWADQSGNGNNFSQVSGSLQPTYDATGLNGLPTIIFNNDELVSGVLSSSISNATIYCVWKMDTDYNGGTIMGQTSGTNEKRLFWYSPEESIYLWDGGIDDQIRATSATYNPLVSPEAFVIRFDGSGFGEGRVNNESFGVEGNVTSVTTSSAAIKIGNRGGGAARRLQGRISQLIVYPGEHTDTQVNIVMNYLNSRYSIW